MCDVKTFDYTAKKPVVPDPTDPKPVRPVPIIRRLNLKQKVALMVWDAAPMGRAAVAAAVPQPRNPEWVKQMMDKNDKDFEAETKPAGNEKNDVPANTKQDSKPVKKDTVHHDCGFWGQFELDMLQMANNLSFGALTGPLNAAYKACQDGAMRSVTSYSATVVSLSMFVVYFTQ